MGERIIMKPLSELRKLEKLLKHDGLSSSMMRGGFGNLIIRVVFTLLTFLISVALARYMGDENFGEFSFLYAIIMILTIPAQFGLPTLIMRETAKSFETKDWSNIRGVWEWSFRIASGLIILIFLGTLAYIVLIEVSLEPDVIRTLCWGLVLVALISWGSLRDAALRGLHRIIPGQISENILYPGIFVASIFVWGLIFPGNMKPHTAMMIRAVAAFITFFISSLILLNLAPLEIRSTQPSFQNSKHWLTSVFSLAILSGMQLINRWISIIILGLFVSNAQIGYFSVALQLALLAEFGLQVVNPVIAPQIARLHAIGDKRRLQKLATSSARIVLVFNIIITTGFIFLGRQFIMLFYGASYSEAYSVLLILLIGQLVNSITGSVGYLLNMTGYEKKTSLARVTTTIINVILTLILAYRYGILGAAVASALSLVIWNLMLYVLVRKYLDINSMAFGRS